MVELSGVNFAYAKEGTGNAGFRVSPNANVVFDGNMTIRAFGGNCEAGVGGGKFGKYFSSKTNLGDNGNAIIHGNFVSISGNQVQK